MLQLHHVGVPELLARGAGTLAQCQVCNWISFMICSSRFLYLLSWKTFKQQPARQRLMRSYAQNGAGVHAIQSAAVAGLLDGNLTFQAYTLMIRGIVCLLVLIFALILTLIHIQYNGSMPSITIIISTSLQGLTAALLPLSAFRRLTSFDHNSLAWLKIWPSGFGVWV